MKKSEVNRFNKLYKEHQRALKLQGKAKKTIDAYSRAIRTKNLISILISMQWCRAEVQIKTGANGKKKEKYLFNHKALAKVFRARFLTAGHCGISAISMGNQGNSCPVAKISV